MRLPTVIIAAAVLLLGDYGCRRGPETGVVFGEREIRVGEKTITVELALTPAQIEQGLKYRNNLPRDQGMLFVFPRPVQTGFWMKDTWIPLSIAFIDPGGRIINIQDMVPDGGKETHGPEQPFLYALEMNQGWFAANGIRVGDRVEMGRRGEPR